LLIISHLRKNARTSLTNISKNTGIPVSTVFDKVKSNKIIKKHSALIDFAKLGYNVTVQIALQCEKEDREKISAHLKDHQNINSLHRINHGYDYLIECVFKDQKELSFFIEELNEKFQIKNKLIFHIIEEIKKEEFLSRPELI